MAKHEQSYEGKHRDPQGRTGNPGQSRGTHDADAGFAIPPYEGRPQGPHDGWNADR
jgi:hypothetical protein